MNGGKLTGENIPTEGVVYKVTEVTLSPSTLTLDVNKSETLTATITPDNATDQNVTWSSAPNGIVIIASSTDTKTATITATGTGGTSATITATVDGKSAECSVTVNAAQTYTVTLEANGGTVSGGGTFKEGSDVTVTANANSGYRFVRWEENGAQVSTDREYTFTLTADRTLTAVFTRVITYYTLTFETNGGSPIDAVRRAFGTTVNLSGYLPVREGYEFGGWYADAQLTEKVTEIRLNRNRTVYAGWTEKAPEEPEEPQKKSGRQRAGPGRDLSCPRNADSGKRPGLCIRKPGKGSPFRRERRSTRL